MCIGRGIVTCMCATSRSNTVHSLLVYPSTRSVLLYITGTTCTRVLVRADALNTYKEHDVVAKNIALSHT